MSDFTLIFSLAPALAVDAAAVCIAAALRAGRLDGRARFRLVFHFSFFQAAMPFGGWWAGELAGRLVDDWAGMAAGAVLLALAARMFMEGDGVRKKAADPTRGWTLVLLALATSTDAFAAGAVIGMLRLTLFGSCALIGLVTALMCLIGIAAGHRAGRLWGRRMRFGGAILLVLTALRIMVC